MDHDRLFKELLRTFFVEFLELFLPEVVEYFDRGSIEFLTSDISRNSPVPPASKNARWSAVPPRVGGGCRGLSCKPCRAID